MTWIIIKCVIKICNRMNHLCLLKDLHCRFIHSERKNKISLTTNIWRRWNRQTEKMRKTSDYLSRNDLKHSVKCENMRWRWEWKTILLMSWIEWRSNQSRQHFVIHDFNRHINLHIHFHFHHHLHLNISLLFLDAHLHIFTHIHIFHLHLRLSNRLLNK
jgi:hypothetical protein